MHSRCQVPAQWPKRLPTEAMQHPVDDEGLGSTIGPPDTIGLPDGTIGLPDGTIGLPDGTIQGALSKVYHGMPKDARVGSPVSCPCLSCGQLGGVSLWHHSTSCGITSYLMLLTTINLKSPDGTIGPNGTTPQLPRVQVLRRTPFQIFFTNTLMIMFRVKGLCRLVFLPTFVKRSF